MGFFRIFSGSRLVLVATLVFGFFSFYAFFAIVMYILKAISGENDELEKKTFINALAASFVFIFILHLGQMLVRIIYFKTTGEDINILVEPGMLIYALDKPQTHLESFGVDLGVFGIILSINRLRYEELNFIDDIQTIMARVKNPFR